MDPETPVPRSRWRRGVYAAWLVIPFTASQIWALLVLLRLAPLEGLVGQAFVLILLGSVVAIWAGWRWTWRLGRDRDRRPEPAPKPRIPT
ncbi:MAG TPA: hypothetical protein VGL47_15390 [Amycolatopsis sp.]|uniref:Integral membrane protein n=1 Tax=Amycolatopsis nalaikhensis TaxID=715472 RepID=A0ABY8XCW2_9PSEU|nr:hypothetical protein [Amycolatopsis sp. 2-2]WIV53040.1 hypothetical protein QP939_29425 [Amycolatopsis sp. 2-2]